MHAPTLPPPRAPSSRAAAPALAVAGALACALGAACAPARAAPPAAPAPPPAASPAGSVARAAEIAALRARGPAALDELRARLHQVATKSTYLHGEAEALEALIDGVAAQRYATVSGLYWYTDLALARRAAAASGKPILSLRLLGRLDEELSCANSRLFRTTLYANQALAAFLRANFILHWSTERPVPRVTIDVGDGRTITTTTTGNSAHYVLAADGTVLDVLPGVYAPIAFRAELATSLALARRVAALPAAGRAAALRAHHRAAAIADRVPAPASGAPPAARAFADSEGVPRVVAGVRGTAPGDVAFIPGATTLLGPTEQTSAMMRAQRSTISKAAIELPTLIALRAVARDVRQIDPADVAQWAALGQAVWGIRVPAHAGALPPPVVLDPASVALVTRLHAAGPLATPPEAAARVLARLEQSLVADSALNELGLRPRIHAFLAEEQRFDEVNAWLYATVFHTPRADAWLGLVPRTDFTGLPGDGVHVPAT